MIQRIQSLYLLLIAALLIAVLFLPFGVFQTLKETYEYTAFSIKQIGTGGLVDLPVWILAALSTMSAALAFVTIFFFKNRKLQIRLCLMNELLVIVFYLVFGLFAVLASNQLKADYHISFALAIPLIAIMLDLMTIKAINRDEALVKSWDRIR